LGESVVLVTDIIMKPAAASRRLAEGALLINAVYELADGTPKCTAECAGCNVRDCHGE